MKKLLSCDAGATAIEYAILAALVAVASVFFLGEIGFALNSTFVQVGMAVFQGEP